MTVALDRLEELTDEAVGGPARRRVVVLFASVLALESADLGAIGAVAPQLEHAFRIHHAQLGLLASASLIVAAIATIPFGLLVDRVARVRLLGSMVALWGAAMIAAGAAPSYGVLVLARLALGGVMAAGGPALASLTGDYFDPSERARIFGFIGAGELLGAAFGFIVCGNVGALAGWRLAFWVMAPGAFVLAWALIRLLPEPARGGAGRLERGARRFTRAAEGNGLGEHRRGQMRLRDAVGFVLRIRSNVLLIAASALGYFFFAGLRTFGVSFLRAHFHLSTSSTTLLVPAFGVGAIAGVLVSGRIADRMLARGRRDARIVVGAIAYVAASLLLVPGIVSTSLAIALVFYVLAAAGLSGANPPLDAARLDIVPSYLWGRAEAVRTVLRQTAQAVAPLLFGLLADVLGGQGGKGLEYAFLIMLLPLAGSAGIVWAARHSYKRDTAKARR